MLFARGNGGAYKVFALGSLVLAILILTSLVNANTSKASEANHALANMEDGIAGKEEIKGGISMKRRQLEGERMFALSPKLRIRRTSRKVAKRKGRKSKIKKTLTNKVEKKRRNKKIKLQI